jgi:protein-S-isoprenylcysteine O-methyltransferase Ste14
MNALTGIVLTLVATAAWGILHSLLASPGTKQWIRLRIGPAADRGYRLFYNVVAVLTLLPVLAITVRVPGSTLYQIPSPWVFLTTAIQILALLVIVIALLQTGASSFLGLRQIFAPEGPGAPKLQVSGSYRWMRHPLYTSGLVLIWLSPVMTTSTLALYLGFTLYIVIGSRYEERQLAAEFGELYLEYRRRVPAIVPRPWRHY